MPRILFVTFFMVVLACISQGCNETGFTLVSPLREGDFAGNPLPPDEPTVCDPFGGNGGPASAQNGLEAKLTYLPLDAAAISRGRLSTESFSPDAPQVVVSPGRLILSQLNVSTRPFTEGFADQSSGVKLKNLDGEDLVEYFSVQARASIKLGASDTAGDYELALMADDGAILDLDASGVGNAYERWVDNDGTHANKLSCASKLLKLSAGQEFPIKMNYYQGPRVRIALMMLWRKKVSSTVAEPECGQGRGDEYYFQPGATVSDPTAKYSALLSRGWKVLRADNFVLPNSQVNPCATK